MLGIEYYLTQLEVIAKPEELIKKLDSIKSKGYESYFTPEVIEGINALNKKLKNVEDLKKSGKLVGGRYCFWLSEEMLYFTYFNRTVMSSTNL